MKKRLLSLLLAFVFCTLFLCACFSDSTPAITFLYDDGVTAQKQVTIADDFPTAAPTREGYLFLGWADEGGNVYTIEQLAALLAQRQSLTVTAQWQAHTHTFGATKLYTETCQEAAYRGNTCTSCGYVKKTYLSGSTPGDHKWIEADFTTARHCQYCHITEGNPLEKTFYYNLPTVTLTTNDGILPTEKTDIYSAGTFAMTGAEEFNIPTSSCGIRIRGNYTSAPEKKAYRVRFDEKVSLFGRPKNRSWVLLADYLDVSHIKNFAAYNVAALMGGMEFSPLTRHVSVTFNGKWLGVYMLTDQINENEGRVNIEADLTSLGTEVPFLIELDEYADKDEGAELNVTYFIYTVPPEKSYNGANLQLKFNVKYPEKDKRASQEQFNYIQSYVTQSLDVLFGLKPGNWRDYWDEDSLIDHFIVQQWMSNGEIGSKSVFLYKRLGETMKMGPVWDFDWAAGGPNWVTPGFQWETFCNPNLGNGGPGYKGSGQTSWRNNAWFTYLWNNDNQFVVNFYERYQNRAIPVINQVLQELVLYKSVIADAIDAEMAAWNRCQSDLYLNHPYGKASGQYNLVLEYLTDRAAWMSNYMRPKYDSAKAALSK